MISRFVTCLATGLAVSVLSTAVANAADADKPAQPLPHAAGETCQALRGQTGTDVYCASSALKPQGASSYGVDHLFSNKTGEAWVEGKPGQGVGEWITIDFKQPRQVTALIIRNGYQKGRETFNKNSRVSKLRLVFSEGERRTIDVPDNMDLQTIAIDPPVKSFWVQFIIDDVYPGNAYADTAISKLFVTSAPAQ